MQRVIRTAQGYSVFVAPDRPSLHKPFCMRSM